MDHSGTCEVEESGSQENESATMGPDHQYSVIAWLTIDSRVRPLMLCFELHSHPIISPSLDIPLTPSKLSNLHECDVPNLNTILLRNLLISLYMSISTGTILRARHGPALPTFLRCQIADRAIDLIFPCLRISNHHSPPKREALSWVPNKLLQVAYAPR
jgi:hypothetical protein